MKRASSGTLCVFFFNYERMSRQQHMTCFMGSYSILQVGKNFVGESNHTQFDYRAPDPKRPSEGFAACRALLTKCKHYATGGGRKQREQEEELRVRNFKKAFNKVQPLLDKSLPKSKNSDERPFILKIAAGL